jgi:hypothetical protein
MDGNISIFWVFLGIVGTPMVLLALDFFHTRALINRITR